MEAIFFLPLPTSENSSAAIHLLPERPKLELRQRQFTLFPHIKKHIQKARFEIPYIILMHVFKFQYLFGVPGEETPQIVCCGTR